jgi:site-specific recombinase XerC
MNRNELQPVGSLGPGLTVPKSENPFIIYLAGMVPSSRRVVLSRLRHVTDLIGWDDPFAAPWRMLRYQHVAAIRTKLQEEGLAFATVNAVLAAVRGVCREAFRLGQMNAEELTRIRELPSIRGSRLPAGRALPAVEIQKLMEVCARDETAAGRRDAALFAVLYVGGLRRDETSNLDVGDYNLATGEMVIRNGKGNKARAVYVGNGAGEAMRDWLTVRGDEPGPLFYAVNKGGRVIAQRITGQAVYCILERRGREAGIPAFHPHDLRRSFISDLLEAGADISTVASLAGHANVTTTARYDRRGEETKSQAAGLLRLPYIPRDKCRAAGSENKSC